MDSVKFVNNSNLQLPCFFIVNCTEWIVIEFQTIKIYVFLFCLILYWYGNKQILDKLHAHVGSFESESFEVCFDFSSLYNTLPHNLITQKFINLIKFNKSRCGYICSNSLRSFFSNRKHYVNWTFICLYHSNSCLTLFLYAFAKTFINKLLEFPLRPIVHQFLQTSFCTVSNQNLWL